MIGIMILDILINSLKESVVSEWLFGALFKFIGFSFALFAKNNKQKGLKHHVNMDIRLHFEWLQFLKGGASVLPWSLLFSSDESEPSWLKP